MSYNPAPYLRWAKVRPRVTHDLASSGLLPVTTAELLGDARARDAFEITGPSDEGFLPLREAIGARYCLTADHITIAPGAAGANFQSFLALLQRDDDVLIERPGYDPLIAAVQALGANVVTFDRSWNKGFALDPYAIRTALTPATKLIVISNAHNPSGAMAGRSVLEQIGVMADAIGALVLVDEVYAEAQHDDSPMPMPAATLGEMFVSTNSLTKAYGLAGLRCGWIVASPGISERIRITRDVIDGSGPFIAESLSAIAVRDIDRLRLRARRLLAENFAVLKEMASSHPRLEWLEPVAGTTAFPKVKGVDDTTAFVDTLVRDYDTIVVPGHFFQAPAHIRIAFGGDPVKFRASLAQLDRALREMK
ncbi:MAG TPA: aminotransferase class I/II-fold pyridoxal phosphate-dependent enzyme [Vicinamibacterales bacterium]|nr:aminotransferase class I/II-fold pyridoxal phosphate-dependent enzyme [Vicinamibacterales bacterium]